MTMTLTLDGGNESDLASNIGWSRFVDWARLLNPNEFPDLIHLAEYGICQDVPKLQEQLASALEKAKPVRGNVVHTINNLKSLLENRESAGCVMVSNGLSDQPDDEESDIAWQGGKGDLSPEDQTIYDDAE